MSEMFVLLWPRCRAVIIMQLLSFSSNAIISPRRRHVLGKTFWDMDGEIWRNTDALFLSKELFSSSLRQEKGLRYEGERTYREKGKGKMDQEKFSGRACSKNATAVKRLLPHD